MDEIGVVTSAKFDKSSWTTTLNLSNNKHIRLSGDFTHLIGYKILRNGTKYIYKKLSDNKKGLKVKNGNWIGSIIGDTNTTRVIAKVRQNAEKEVSILDFVLIQYQDTHILGQVTDYVRKKDGIAVIHIALIGVINGGNLERVPYPVVQGTRVYSATVGTVEKAFNMDPSGLYIGLIHKTNIPVYISKKMMSIGHTAIMAKIRTGKSYLTRVFAEEINKQGYPIVIFDPRSEYDFSMKNNNEDELKLANKFKIKPMSFGDRFVRFVFDEEKTKHDILINQDILKKDDFYKLLVKPSQISVIDLNTVKSSEEETQVVASISQNLLEARKHDIIPPLFLVVEEAEKYIPEGKSNNPAVNAISDIAMQGAQKGLDLVIVGHRPSKIKKDVLSQCFNFSILQVSWDNDKQRIKQSVEDATQYIDIISSLPVGTAFLSGAFVNRPLLVDVRIAHTKHFGQTVETNIAFDTVPQKIAKLKEEVKKLGVF